MNIGFEKYKPTGEGAASGMTWHDIRAEPQAPEGSEIDAKACKMLYQIKVHPATREQYAKCCEYLHRFYTQEMPEGMDYKE